MATENLDTLPFPSDVSTPPSDQMEVSDDQVGGPAVVPLPKVMTPVSCLNEICVVRKLSIPQYESKGEVALPQVTIFSMEVWVRDMNLRGMLHPGI